MNKNIFLKTIGSGHPGGGTKGITRGEGKEGVYREALNQKKPEIYPHKRVIIIDLIFQKADKLQSLPSCFLSHHNYYITNLSRSLPRGYTVR